MSTHHASYVPHAPRPRTDVNTRTLQPYDYDHDYASTKMTAAAIAAVDCSRILNGPAPFRLTMRCCGAVYSIPRWRGIDYVPPSHQCADDNDGRIDSPTLRASRQARQRRLAAAAAAANGATTLSKLDAISSYDAASGTTFIYPSTAPTAYAAPSARHPSAKGRS